MAADARPRILLVGGSGQVGRELRRSLAPLGEVVAPGRGDLDLGAPSSISPAVRAARPNVIVNAAAYTTVDRAEDDEATARLVNAVGPGLLAEEAERLGAILVHYSTDYVFDGTKTGWYEETDTPAPLSAYGRTKLEGERAVASACRRHLTFRTSWVFSLHPPNFLLTMLRLAAERDTLRVVADQHGAPTGAALIADITAVALSRQLHDDGDRWGLYHLVASGETTWHAYASWLVARASALGMPLRVAAEHVVPITTAEFPTRAARPVNSRLSTHKLRSTFGVSLPAWQEGVDDVLQRLEADRT